MKVSALSELRQQSMIRIDEPAFSVRLASISELLKVQQEAKADGSTAKWSSADALLNQLAAGTNAILIPTIRNGGPTSLPETWRCHIWFVEPDNKPAVSLLDLRRETFLSLRELTETTQFKKAVRLLIEGYMLAALQ